MSKKRVLIVDDNQANLILARDIARFRGCDTIETEDAESAIELARKEKPDLILMDIRLPGMSGLDATSLLKSDPQTASIRIVAITASVFKEDREKAISAGCDDFLEKPLRFDVFNSVIGKYLD